MLHQLEFSSFTVFLFIFKFPNIGHDINRVEITSVQLTLQECIKSKAELGVQRNAEYCQYLQVG